MMRPMAAGLAVLLTATSVLAQSEQTETPPNGTVPLRLAADAPGAEFELRIDRKSPPYTCRTPCTVWVYPGRYRVKMRGDFPSRSHDVDVVGPTRVDGVAGSSSGRTGGLALGAGGGALVLVGLFGIMLSDPCGWADCGSRQGEKVDTTPWLVVMGVGAVTTTVGWILFGSSGSSLNVASSRPTVGVAPTRDGAAMAATWTF